ncbi:Hypothetical_protein [Hexamita inflata]|uniref:Hypothetical_protein n=1 Tax=Hexamita inflata TaxID=28002 RepID=A0AA86QPV3_9EUKA|nr:Hypothetical protein HINF_LOCUS2328 [Hexamita inflata]CAI9957918.1 Hypothetical protein HINF_LOCUS45563 [Hexamita inflata]CAI9961721.1 Hypothetical protein HINF_LOCUS49366 [Hexamita inflata]
MTQSNYENNQAVTTSLASAAFLQFIIVTANCKLCTAVGSWAIAVDRSAEASITGELAAEQSLEPVKYIGKQRDIISYTYFISNYNIYVYTNNRDGDQKWMAS